VQLISGNGKDKLTTKLVANYDWYILPVDNPDGYEYTKTTVNYHTIIVFLYFKYIAYSTGLSILLEWIKGGGSGTFSFGGPVGPWFWVGAFNRNNYRSPTTNHTMQVFGSDA